MVLNICHGFIHTKAFFVVFFRCQDYGERCVVEQSEVRDFTVLCSTNSFCFIVVIPFGSLLKFLQDYFPQRKKKELALLIIFLFNLQ